MKDFRGVSYEKQIRIMDVQNSYDIVVIGGGAAGFFAAIHAPHLKVALFEKTLKVLSKVRISGGGRCNVTHGCFDPRELIQYYPRGSKELLAPFIQFQPQNTIEWFRDHGVELKEESDGRIFPVTDTSETIIECLMLALKKAQVELHTGISIEEIAKTDKGFILKTKEKSIHVQRILLATGSSPQGYRFAQDLGHTITPPIPSLFTLNVPSSPLLDLAGISIANVRVGIEETSLQEKGPLLLTHWGFSGPAVLKLSAWGAKDLYKLNYKATLIIDWTGGMKRKELKEQLMQIKKEKPHEEVSLDVLSHLPKKLAKRLLENMTLKARRFSDLSLSEIERFMDVLTGSRYSVEGKTTYKSEFVTCGGIQLAEVNFKTMESRLCPGLFFAGEILDIDGITGGFNFQNAWTTGWIAGQSMASTASKSS